MASMGLEQVSAEVLKYETFINDVLKQDLKIVHDRLQRKNQEVADWIQLKNMIQNIKEIESKEGIKTKMDIGTNIYVQAHVPDTSNIIIDIGSGIFVEYNLNEALMVIAKRSALLMKQIDLINEQSAKIKARIKFVLHLIQELQNVK